MTEPFRNDAPVGSVVFQPPDLGKPMDWIIALRSPKYAHCGIYAGDGRMIAATGAGVRYQDAGAAGNVIAVPRQGCIPMALVTPYLGRPYDYLGLVSALIPGLHTEFTDRCTCSSLIGRILQTMGVGRFYRQTTPHDILAAIS